MKPPLARGLSPDSGALPGARLWVGLYIVIIIGQLGERVLFAGIMCVLSQSSIDHGVSNVRSLDWTKGSITAYFKNKQILPFSLAWQSRSVDLAFCQSHPPSHVTIMTNCVYSPEKSRRRPSSWSMMAQHRQLCLYLYMRCGQMLV